MKTPGVPTDGLSLTVLADALAPYATISSVNSALNTKLNTTGGAVSGLLSFTGLDSVGVRLKSLTSAQYGNLTPSNGDLFLDTTANRVDVRLNGVTQELLDTGGGQRINGTLGISGFLTDAAGSNRLRFDNNGSGATRVISDGSIFLERFANNGVVNLGTSANHNLVLIRNSATQVTLASGSTDVTGNLSATGTVTGNSANATSVAMIARAAASQSANIQEWQNSASALLASIYPAGQINSQNTTQILLNQGTVVIGRNGGNQLQYGEGAFWQRQVFYTNGVSRFEISHTGAGTLTTAPGSAVVGSIVRGAASQTANLQEWQNSANTVVASVSPAGNLTASGTINAQTNLDFFNGANFTRATRTSGTNGRLTIFRPGSTVTPAVSFGTGNEELFIGPSGEGSIRVGGGVLTVGCSNSLLIDSLANNFTFRGAASTTMATLTGVGNLNLIGELQLSTDTRMQRSVQALTTQVFDTSLAAWQTTHRSEASATGARFSVLGATPIVRQSLPAAATDAATTQSLANSIRSLLINFGFAN